jgi:hypothetical protein
MKKCFLRRYFLCCLMGFVSLFFSELADAASSKNTSMSRKSKKKKLLIEIADPKVDKSVSRQAPVEAVKDSVVLEDIEMPTALVGERSVGPTAEELKFFDSPGLSQKELHLLNSFVLAKNWSLLLSTLNLWLLVRHDLHEGERLRLELIKARTLGQLHRYSEAHELLKYYQRYLKIAEKDLFRVDDRIRHKSLKAHWYFVAEDLNRLERGSAL